jgi:type VI secretion system protein VasG
MDSNIRLLVEQLNSTCRRALEQAAQLCVKQTHYAVDIEHYLFALLEMPNTDIAVILDAFRIPLAEVKTNVLGALGKLKGGNTRTPSISNHLVELLDQARKIVLSLGMDSIRSGAVLMALYRSDALRTTMVEISPALAFIQRDVLWQQLRDLLERSYEDRPDAPQAAPPHSSDGGILASESPATPRSNKALDSYTTDLTAQARSGALDPIVGRDAEIRLTIDILTRRRQNNPILTGEPGVGKTAVVEGLAQKIARGDVPPMLRDVRLLSLDMGLLQAGASMKGEFENRLKQVIQEVKSSPQPIILFIDEAHTLIGAGGAAGQNDAANLLKPALARGELRTIAATTWAEYKAYFEKDPALTRRFQVVKIEEPSVESAINMLRGMVEKFEYHHKVRILDDAVTHAVTLSHRYLPERKLPDKALSVLDTACARVAITQTSVPARLEALDAEKEFLEKELASLEREHRLVPRHAERIEQLRALLDSNRHEAALTSQRWEREKELVERIAAVLTLIESASSNDDLEAKAAQTEEYNRLSAELRLLQADEALVQPFVDSYTIARVISDWTGIPVGKMLADNVASVHLLEDALARRIKGQPHAISAICKRMRTAMAGLSDPNKPTAVFLLVGPSGVGKTETAIALAEAFFGGEKNLTVIAMSEYQEAHTVSLLKGAPPGYVGYGKGGVLTEAVRRNPYSVVLLDEVEKAHPDVLEIFYQVFDKGMLEDSEGVEVNFKNTVIFLTSNLATETIVKLHTRSGGAIEMEELIEAIRPELQAHFKPALLGRMVVVPYYPLGQAELAEIVRLKMARIQRLYRERYNAPLHVTDGIIEEIARRCTDPDSGARNIDNILTHTVLPELSQCILDRLAAKEPIGEMVLDIGQDGQFVYRTGDMMAIADTQQYT